MTIKTRDDLKMHLKNTTCEYTMIKIHAPWCGPCKKIEPLVNSLVQEAKLTHGDDFNFISINADDSFDLFALFKRKKVLKGIPALLLYKHSDFDESVFYIPSECVLGADENAIKELFNEM